MIHNPLPEDLKNFDEELTSKAAIVDGKEAIGTLAFTEFKRKVKNKKLTIVSVLRIPEFLHQHTDEGTRASGTQR